MVEPEIKLQGYGFATYPSVKLYSYQAYNKKGKKKFGFIKELLFGDFIKPVFRNGEYVPLILGKKRYIKVKARERYGYILEDGIQSKRILEVNFIDAEHGDSCHLATPEDKHFIIDAGRGTNMFRFLSWRFNLRKPYSYPPPFIGVVTHSDSDHYSGYTPIFTQEKSDKKLFDFERIYHNGMVEESGRSIDTLGSIISVKGQKYVTDLAKSEDDFLKRKSSVKRAGNYIKMLEKTDAPKSAVNYGSPPIYDDSQMKIEVLGPYPKNIDNKQVLPVFSNDKAETKNGHSVILKLTIGKMRLLFGGNLNAESEYYLLKQFTKVDVKALKLVADNPNNSEAERIKAKEQIDLAVKHARSYFETDITKTCHHNNRSFTNEFLMAMNPVATIVSSSDEETYSHPRPEVLGRIGKYSKGERPLILSAELLRSSNAFTNENNLSELKWKERMITVYGMINLRTDGERVVIAQKLEKTTDQKSWDIHKLEWNPNKESFQYV